MIHLPQTDYLMLQMILLERALKDVRQKNVFHRLFVKVLEEVRIFRTGKVIQIKFG